MNSRYLGRFLGVGLLFLCSFGLYIGFMHGMKGSSLSHDNDESSEKKNPPSGRFIKNSSRPVFHLYTPKLFSGKTACGVIAAGLCFDRLQNILKDNPQASLLDLSDALWKGAEGIKEVEDSILEKIIEVVEKSEEGALAKAKVFCLEEGEVVVEPEKTTGEFLKEVSGNKVDELRKFLSGGRRLNCDGPMLCDFLQNGRFLLNNCFILNDLEISDDGKCSFFGYSNKGEEYLSSSEYEYGNFSLEEFLFKLAEKVKLKIIPYALFVTDKAWKPLGHWAVFLLRLGQAGTLELVCCDSDNAQDVSNIEKFGTFAHAVNRVMESVDLFFDKKAEKSLDEIAKSAVACSMDVAKDAVLTDSDLSHIALFEGVETAKVSLKDVNNLGEKVKEAFLEYVHYAVKAFVVENEKSFERCVFDSSRIFPQKDPGVLVLPCGHVCAVENLMRKFDQEPIFRMLGHAPAIHCKRCAMPIPQTFYALVKSAVEKNVLPVSFRTCSALLFFKESEEKNEKKAFFKFFGLDEKCSDETLSGLLQKTVQEGLPYFDLAVQRELYTGVSCAVLQSEVEGKLLGMSSQIDLTVSNEKKVHHIFISLLSQWLSLSEIRSLFLPEESGKEDLGESPEKTSNKVLGLKDLRQDLTVVIKETSQWFYNTQAFKPEGFCQLPYIERLLLQGCSVQQIVRLFKCDEQVFLRNMIALDTILTREVSPAIMDDLKKEIESMTLLDNDRKKNWSLVGLTELVGKTYLSRLLERGDAVRVKTEEFLKELKAKKPEKNEKNEKPE